MRLLTHVSTIFLAAILLVCGPASAQNSNATLHATITDQGGGVLPGVTVKLKSAGTGLARDVVTNASGGYVFNFLPAGDYELTAELAGFKSARRADVTLEIGQSLEDLKMEVGQLEEVVNVEGTATATGSELGSSVAMNSRARNFLFCRWSDIPRPSRARTSVRPVNGTLRRAAAGSARRQGRFLMAVWPPCSTRARSAPWSPSYRRLKTSAERLRQSGQNSWVNSPGFSRT